MGAPFEKRSFAVKKPNADFFSSRFRPIKLGQKIAIKKIPTAKIIANKRPGIIPAINKNDNANVEKAKILYKSLIEKGIDVLFDDIDENISNKFKKHDLLGIPFQIIIGSKSSKDLYEFKEIGLEAKMLDLKQIIKLIKN